MRGRADQPGLFDDIPKTPIGDMSLFLLILLLLAIGSTIAYISYMMHGQLIFCKKYEAILKERNEKLKTNCNICNIDMTIPEDIKKNPISYLELLNKKEKRISDGERECYRPMPFVIDDNILHFVNDEWEKFEDDTDVERGKKIIIQKVKDYIKQRARIVISGYCDNTGNGVTRANQDSRGPFSLDIDEHNMELSYMRAFYVGRLIDGFLRSNGLKPNKDYEIIMQGYGRSKISENGGQSLEAWRKSNRRIMLSFEFMPSPEKEVCK